MLVLYALRQNGPKKIHAVFSSLSRTPAILTVVQTRKFSALSDVDANDRVSDAPPLPKKAKVSKKLGMPDRDLWRVYYHCYSRHNILQVTTNRNCRRNYVFKSYWHSLESWSTRVSAWRSGKCSHKCCFHWVKSCKISPCNQTYYVFFFRATSFALFVKPQLKWRSPPLTTESISKFRKRMNQYGYASNMVLPHSNYLINLGNPDRFVQQPFYALPRMRPLYPQW